ncbi:polyamine aminopropyltransferase [Actinomyces bowdenii]|uniref:Polyamine aminopropyltransferase n=1 Tax=Actinomyces bowdenii TaxID=131109 RepID=A0A3P1V9I0_9ACTO|nr:polyamine aminopropyltransferase [Actinomyces bowdenii]RRD29243.1 polyamine aminopropyltransferase [Actinomyces bowdenii]
MGTAAPPARAGRASPPPADGASRSGHGRRENAALFAAALLVAVGGLIYELILGTAASYLIGDSVLSFSLAMGITLFGMGIGSLLVNRVRRDPAVVFAVNEIVLGLVGGNSVLALYAAFGLTDIHWWVFGAISLTIGVLIGAEIPLLVRTFQRFGRASSAELVSKVLALDYFGALAASLIFPLVLLPQLGLMRGAYLVGALNVLVAMVVLIQVGTPRRVLVAGVAAAVALTGLFLGADRLERSIDTRTYGDPVVYYEQTAYQRIVLTQYGQDLRLYLNGQLQFSSLDEARYHETLSASAMTSVQDPARVLILGGGDGLLAREVLRYPGLERLTLVDIDPRMTELSRTNRLLRESNNDSLSDPRVEVVNQDAFAFTAEAGRRGQGGPGRQGYDVVLIDLVDPSNERLAKLYSVEFYRQVERLLSDDGVMVTQATSSFFSPRAFSTVDSTVAAAQPGRSTYPFSINVPSFGEWGFVLSTRRPDLLLTGPLPQGLVHQDRELLRFIMLDHPVGTTPMPASTLLRPRIVEVYNDDMRQWRYT